MIDRVQVLEELLKINIWEIRIFLFYTAKLSLRQLLFVCFLNKEFTSNLLIHIPRNNIAGFQISVKLSMY